MVNYLISAYSVNPYKGSEDSIGWNWVLQYEKNYKEGDRIILLTKKFNEKDTRRGLKEFNAVETKNRKAAETNEILRHDRIMQQFILLYLEGYASIAIPNKLDVSEIHINVAEDDEFAFTDLAGMYDASLMIPKKGAKSSIEIYYENEEKLAKYVMNVIENVNFEFYPELLDTLTEFYRIYIKSDEKEIVLWPLTVDDLDNRKLIITAMTNMIKSKDNDWVAQNAKGKLNGNVMKSYVTLYLKAREERKLIAKYTQEINKVKLQNGQS